MRISLVLVAVSVVRDLPLLVLVWLMLVMNSSGGVAVGDGGSVGVVSCGRWYYCVGCGG